VAWSSKIFRALIADMFGNVAAFDLDSDTLKNSLFDNSITPTGDATSANSAYGAGVWASGGVADASGWPAAGRALGSVVIDAGTSATVKLTAANTVSANSTTTLASVYGCLIHDTTLTTPVSDQGICFLSLGGTNSVTAGTFTVAYSASGVLSISL